MEIKCPKCFASYDDKSPVCPYCGSPTGIPANTQNTSPVGGGNGFSAADNGMSSVSSNEPPVSNDVLPTENNVPPTENNVPPVNNDAPSADNNMPPQGGYTPPQGGYTPPQGGYTPPQGGYTPPQGGYAPPRGSYTPPQGGYTPPQGGITPPSVPPKKKKKTGLIIALVLAGIFLLFLVVGGILLAVFWDKLFPKTPDIVSFGEGTTVLDYCYENADDRRSIDVYESGYYMLKVENTDSVDYGITSYINLTEEGYVFEPEVIVGDTTDYYDEAAFCDYVIYYGYFEASKSYDLDVYTDNETDDTVDYTVTFSKVTDVADGYAGDESFYCFTAPGDGYYAITSDEGFWVSGEEAVGYQESKYETENAHYVYAAYFYEGESVPVIPEGTDWVEYSAVTDDYEQAVSEYSNYKENGIYVYSSEKIYESASTSGDSLTYTTSAYHYPVGFEVKDTTLWLYFEANHPDYGETLVYYPVSLY